MAKNYRYKLVMRSSTGGTTTFRNTGSYGLKSLAEKKLRQIVRKRKKAGLRYGGARVVKYDPMR